MLTTVRTAAAARRFAMVAGVIAIGEGSEGVRGCLAIMLRACEVIRTAPSDALAELGADRIDRLAALAEVAMLCSACGACEGIEGVINAPSHGAAPGDPHHADQQATPPRAGGADRSAPR